MRSKSNGLNDLVYVGKEGVTENVINQITDNLFAHELIKIKVQKTAPEELNEVAEQIVDACNCQVVAIIGSKIILYKVTNKKNFKHYL